MLQHHKHNLLAKTKSTPLLTLFPLPDLPGLFSAFFHDKIIKIRHYRDSQLVCTISLPLTNPFDGVLLCTFKAVSESVVKNLILKSAPKTCQLDPIPTPLLVECLGTLLPSLTALVNSSLSSGIFPQVFKTALVAPLLKKTSLDQNDLKNYRPVSNLSFVSKITEKLVLSQLSDHLSANSLYNHFHSSYQPGHSTETALQKIVSDLLALGDGTVPLLALLDLSAVFDTIDHSMLLHRLHHELCCVLTHSAEPAWRESFVPLLDLHLRYIHGSNFLLAEPFLDTCDFICVDWQEPQSSVVSGSFFLPLLWGLLW